jgi:sporulation protein YlmC with PRC-barrel domain
MNKTRKILIVLGSIFCLVLLGGSAFSQGYSTEFPEAIVGGTYQPMGWNTYEASWLIGHRVTTPEGGTLGQISSFVIDRANGRVALVVLSDVPNLGGEPLAIPFSSVLRTGEGTFQFNPGDMEVGVPFSYSDSYVYAVTQYSSFSGLYGIPSVMDVAWLTEIYSHYGQAPYWTEEGGQSPMVSEFYESTELMGAEVRLPKGEAVGQINDFVIDSSDGRIVFLVLYNVPGRGDTLVAVPFGTFSGLGENALIINTSEDQLASAPGFNEFSDLRNPRWAGDVYRSFGLSPYWSEKEEIAPSPGRSERMKLKPYSLEWYQMYGY